MPHSENKYNVVQALLNHPAAQMLAGILALTSISDLLAWYRQDSVNLFLLLLVAGCLIFSLILAKRKTTHILLPNVNDARLFFPFLSHFPLSGERDTSDLILFDRKEEAAMLECHLRANANKHCFLVGESGIGKSLFLTPYFKEKVTLGGPHGIGPMCTPITEYAQVVDIFQEIHSRISDHIASTDKHDFELHFKELRKALGEVFSIQPDQTKGFSSAFNECIERIDEYVDGIVLQKNRHPIVVFDQAERLHLSFQSSVQAERLDLPLVRHFVERLRTKEHIYTLFVLRSDFAIQLIHSLAHIDASGTARQPIDVTSLFVLSGLLMDKAEQVNRLIQGFNAAIRDRYGDPRREEKLLKAVREALRLDKQTGANSFLIQLAGYMLENFADDPRLGPMFNTTQSLSRQLMELYLEKLSAEYYMVTANARDITPHDAENVLHTVLFVVAVENASSGRSLSPEILADIAHLPLEPVVRAVEYLAEKGVFIRAQKGSTEFRIAHDLLGEHIEKWEQLAIRPEYRTAFRSYTKLQDYQENLSKSVPQRNILLDLLNRRPCSIPQAVILACMCLCVFRALWPMEALEVIKPVVSLITRLGPLGPSEEQPRFSSIEYYLPVMVVQFLWVSFMYKLDRAYFARLSKERKRSISEDGVMAEKGRGFRVLTRALSASGAPLGGIVGVLVMFAPSLFIVPIVVGGVFLGLAYWAHSLNLDVRGPAKAGSRELATKIGLNMVISLGVMFLMHVLLYYTGFSENSWWVLSVIWFFCFCYAWYWLAMQPRQGSQQGWSTLLLIYDYSRKS